MARTPKSTDDSAAAKPAKAKAKAPKPKAAKPAAVKPAAAKPAAAKPALKVVAKPAEAAPAKASAKASLKLTELVERVADATGAKKPEAKKSVEATLAALSAALHAGTDINLPPLGKLRVARTAGSVLTLKLRTGAGEKAGAKPLADDGEDD